MAARIARTQFVNLYDDPEYQEKHRELFSGSLLQPLAKVLPPSMQESEFDRVIEKVISIIGSENVAVGKALEDYIDPYEFMSEEQRKVPSAAFCPGSVDELQSILQVANSHNLPLWTFSRGKNLGYGGPAPAVTGAVALDLHRMNRILEVNEKFSYAVVEPGVTFTDLYKYCAQHKLRVWPSVPSLGWGSVMGNTLDRGCGITPTHSHWQNIAGIEVVLADGEVVRTGQFAISNSPTAHVSKFSFGPSLEGLFLQSNLGVVTKLGIWLFPQPEAFMSCSWDMPEFEDIKIMTEVLGPLRQSGVLASTVNVGNIIEHLAMFGERSDFWTGPGPIPPWRIEELKKQIDHGYWRASFGIYGPKEIVQAHFDHIKRIISRQAPTGRLLGSMFSGENGEELIASTIPEPHGGGLVGIPSLWILPMVKFHLPKDKPGKAAHIDFSSLIPSDGDMVLEWCKISKHISESHGRDLFCDYFMHERHVMLVNMMTYDRASSKSSQTVDAMWRDLHHEATEKSYGNYRTHIRYMDLVQDQFDFNNHAYRRFLQRLKGTVDPHGILSPGKQGIWPQGYDVFSKQGVAIL